MPQFPFYKLLNEIQAVKGICGNRVQSGGFLVPLTSERRIGGLNLDQFWHPWGDVGGLSGTAGCTRLRNKLNRDGIYKLSDSETMLNYSAFYWLTLQMHIKPMTCVFMQNDSSVQKWVY